MGGWVLGFSFKDCALTENELQPYPRALTAGTFRSGKQTDVDVSVGSSKDSRSGLLLTWQTGKQRKQHDPVTSTQQVHRRETNLLQSNPA